MTAIHTPNRLAVRLYRDFDAPRIEPAQWAAIAATGDTCTVFQDWYWQRTWWECFGRGELALLVAQDDTKTVALAPFFVDSRMAYLVGSGGSDYLDFIGNVSGQDVVHRILEALREAHPDLLGIVLYLVPDHSRTAALIQHAAAKLGLACFDQGALVAPAMSMRDPPATMRAACKKSLMRHERFFLRSGDFLVRNLRGSAEILPWLESFFAQHERRWRETDSPSLFAQPAQRAFYRRLATCADAAGWLRFTVLLADSRSVAFHFGFAHQGSFLWYKPSFDVALARRSPGEVLLRQLILAAQAEGLQNFDFGLGDETFKRRFADQFPMVRTWGLYPSAGAA